MRIFSGDRQSGSCSTKISPQTTTEAINVPHRIAHQCKPAILFFRSSRNCASVNAKGFGLLITYPRASLTPVPTGCQHLRHLLLCNRARLQSCRNTADKKSRASAPAKPSLFQKRGTALTLRIMKFVIEPAPHLMTPKVSNGKPAATDQQVRPRKRS